MNRINTYIALIVFLTIIQFQSLRAQPNDDFTTAKGFTFSASDLVGGFGTIAYTFNGGILDHTTLSAGYMLFDGILPEYYVGYMSLENAFLPLTSGFTLSYAQSLHLMFPARENFNIGYKIRFIYRQNDLEFDSHALFMLTLGYHFYLFNHILIYPSLQGGLAQHYSRQPQYSMYWDKQLSLVAALSLNVGYMF